MIEHAASRSRVPQIRLFEEALPAPLFERLVAAIRALGDERLDRNYTTTFWLPLAQQPRNVAEEAALELAKLVEPGPSCSGIEWWVGRLRHGQKLRFHFDRDMTIRRETGRYVHPLLASVLYLNRFEASPTVVLDQVPSEDGRARVPPRSLSRTSFAAVPNHYLVFPGNRRHGVVPKARSKERSGPRSAEITHAELRLTLLVNFWEQRPRPPICFDYDGTIYAALQDRPTGSAEKFGSFVRSGTNDR